MVHHRLVSGLPESLALLPRSPVPPCTPCVEGRQRAAPHSSSFPPTTAPFQTLHLDVWGTSPLRGPRQERYFLIVVDDYSRYTTVLPLQRKADVPTVLEPWLLARVRYAAHQLNLWPSDARPRVTPVSLWTGSPGIAADYRVWGSLAHVRAPGANKLSARTRACVFLGFPLDTSGWQFYDQVTCQYFSSQDVTFNESVSYYKSRPHKGFETFSPLLFLTTEPTPVAPVAPPPSRPAPSSVSHVTTQSSPPQHPVPTDGWGAGGAVAEGEGTGAARAGGVGSGGAGGVGVEVTPMEDTATSSRWPRPTSPPTFPSVPQFPPRSSLRPVAAEPGGVLAGGTGGPEGVGGGGAGSGGAGVGGNGTMAPTLCTSTAAAAAAAVEAAAAGGVASVAAARESRGGVTVAAEESRGGVTAAAGESRGGVTTAAAGAVAAAARESRGGVTSAAVDEVADAAGESRGGVMAAPGEGRSGVPPAAVGVVTDTVGESKGSFSSSQWTCRSPLSRAVSPEPRRSRYRADSQFHLVLRSRVPPPPVLPQPPKSSLTVLHNPLSDFLCSCRLVVSRVLSALVTHPTAPLSSVSALVTTVASFASSHCLDYSYLVSGTACSPSTGGVHVLPMEVLEDRQFELCFLAAAVPHLCAMLLAPEGDPDALDIPIPRNHAEAVLGPCASYWIAAEEAEMASYRSTGTYVDAVPPPGTNVVSGMWLYKVKRPPGSPPVFKARYVARGFSQREGVDFFQTFAPTPKITTLRVLLHIAAQREYELHSLDFLTAFLQGSLHEQIWLRRVPGFTGSFLPGTQWQLCRPVYGLRQAPREWHDTLRSTLAALDFFASSADPSLFVRRGSTPFFVLVYVDDLVFATPDQRALASVKDEMQRRHTYTDLGELQLYLGLQITKDRAARTITLTQSHMVEQILTRFHFPFSKVQLTSLAVDHGLTTPPSDESFESSGPYLELVGCLMYLMTCTRPDLAYPLSVLARFVVPGRHRPSHWYAAKRVAKYVASTSGMGLGYSFSLRTCAVSWRSAWASSVSGSSCEAEVYAAAMVA
ncbi:unnamed protein product [Closterium sp. NIES-53]